MDKKRPFPLASQSSDSGSDFGYSSSPGDESEEEKDRPTQQVFHPPFDDENSDSQPGEKDFRARKRLKPERKGERVAKNMEEQASKRERESDMEEKGSFRKRKKGSSGNTSTVEQNLQKTSSKNTSQIEKASNEEHVSLPNGDRKEHKEKAALAPGHNDSSEPTKKSSKQRIVEKNVPSSQTSGPVPQKKESRTEREARAKKASVHPESGFVKETNSPEKRRKPTQIWTPKDEIGLSSEVLDHVKFGADIPNKKSDEFWLKLSEQLQGKLESEWSRDQLWEKVRRMKTRYDTMADKVRDSDKPYKYRNSTDPVLFSLWSQMWGGKAEDRKSKDNEEVGAGKEEACTTVVLETDPGRIREPKSTQGKKEQDAPKGKQAKKKSSDADKLISERSDDIGALAGISFAIKSKKGTSKFSAKVQNVHTSIPMEKECMPQNIKSSNDIANGLDRHEGGTPSDPSSDIIILLRDGVRPLLQEIQEASKVVLEEWLAKAVAFIEKASKAAAGNSGLINRMDLTEILGSSSPPWRNWELRELHFSHSEPALKQQLYELHLQELDIYSQRLQLLQQECKLRQEQVRLQLERDK